MSRTVFLESILPSIRVGSDPGILFDDVMTLYRDNLGFSDLEKVKVIRGYIDLKNIQNLLRKEEIDHRGNLNEKELDDAIVNQEGLPIYLFDFLEEYQEIPEQLRNYSKIFISFFKEMDKKHWGFLREYFRFERSWRALLAGYRAKKLGVDPAVALQHEDFHDPLIAEILAQKDAPFFEFPFEYVGLGEKLKDVGQKPDKQYQLMADFRFHRIRDMVQDHRFSIDYLLGYLVQLMIVEDAFALDEKRGSENLNEMVKGNL
ncbi:MAG: DUF2764 family protein [Candidatus Neptunochlamydia sp.]|nr:DUF2764 family protein [Candidatus Neptunochlamydia sp.]